MAHQCLKCGKSYADGSPQILKGCEGCKGTRFFYTDAPIDESARAALAEKADLDVERLALGKGGGADKDAPPRRIPTKGELPVGRGGESTHDWVAGGPAYLRGVVEDVVRRASERKPVFRVGEAEPGPKKTLAQWIAEEGGGASADLPADVSDDLSGPTDTGRTDGRDSTDAGDLIDDLFAPERERAWREAADVPADEADEDGALPIEPPSDADPAAPAVPSEEVVYKRTPRPIPKPVSLAGRAIDAEEDAALREEAKRARALLDEARPSERRTVTRASGIDESLYPEGEAPETVQVSRPGVYELDVKRLLEKSPIVVHKDGTYSLHLPSLMESLEGRKRRPDQ